MRPFDVYRGDQVGPGKKSIAFHVEFRSPERTLSDEDAAGLRKRIVDELEQPLRSPPARLSRASGKPDAAPPT